MKIVKCIQCENQNNITLSGKEKAEKALRGKIHKWPEFEFMICNLKHSNKIHITSFNKCYK